LTVASTTLVEGSLGVGAGARLNAGGSLSVGESLSHVWDALANSAATSTTGASMTNSGTIDVQCARRVGRPRTVYARF
jgi:hypothetical protein